MLTKLTTLFSGVSITSLSATITYYNQEVRIGKGNFGGYWDGYLARVRKYDRVLTETELEQLRLE